MGVIIIFFVIIYKKINKIYLLSSISEENIWITFHIWRMSGLTAIKHVMIKFYNTCYILNIIEVCTNTYVITEEEVISFAGRMKGGGQD